MINFLVAFFCFFSTTFSNDFVMPKKKKQPSVSQLKEVNCVLFGDYLKTVPVLLNELSRVQLKCIDALQGYFESDKKSLCEQMSKEQLALCQLKQEEIHELSLQLIDKLQEFDHFCVTIRK